MRLRPLCPLNPRLVAPHPPPPSRRRRAGVPEQLTKEMAQDVSVPIMFVCLLHLCNENSLALKMTHAMDDLLIAQ